MSKKKVAKPKSESRKPRLAPFVDEAFDIFINLSGKEYKARVRADGMIAYDGKEFFSPSAAAMAINGDKKRMIDGWHFFTFNKNGKRARLDTLRGAKSPLKCVADSEPRKAKKAAKPKRTAKPRAPKPPSQKHMDDHSLAVEREVQSAAGV